MSLVQVNFTIDEDNLKKLDEMDKKTSAYNRSATLRRILSEYFRKREKNIHRMLYK